MNKLNNYQTEESTENRKGNYYAQCSRSRSFTKVIEDDSEKSIQQYIWRF